MARAATRHIPPSSLNTNSAASDRDTMIPRPSLCHQPDRNCALHTSCRGPRDSPHAARGCALPPTLQGSKTENAYAIALQNEPHTAIAEPADSVVEHDRMTPVIAQRQFDIFVRLVRHPHLSATIPNSVPTG